MKKKSMLWILAVGLLLSVLLTSCMQGGDHGGGTGYPGTGGSNKADGENNGDHVGNEDKGEGENHENKGEQPFSEGLEFVLSADGESYTLVGSGTCTDTVIIVPPTYNGKPVTAVEGSNKWNVLNLLDVGWVNPKFKGCTSVILPDSITSIGSSAFKGCTNFKNVTFKDTNGWKRTYTIIDSADLANPATAATYLTQIYSGDTWTKRM